MTTATKPCYFCDDKVEEEDYFCSGCNVIVCGVCNTAESIPFGNHEPEDHLTEEN